MIFRKAIAWILGIRSPATGQIVSLFWSGGKRTWLGRLFNAHSESLSWIGRCPCRKRQCRSMFGLQPFTEGFLSGIQSCDMFNAQVEVRLRHDAGLTENVTSGKDWNQ